MLGYFNVGRILNYNGRKAEMFGKILFQKSAGLSFILAYIYSMRSTGRVEACLFAT